MVSRSHVAMDRRIMLVGLIIFCLKKLVSNSFSIDTHAPGKNQNDGAVGHYGQESEHWHQDPIEQSNSV